MAREGLREMDKASSTFDLHGFCLLVLCVIFSTYMLTQCLLKLYTVSVDLV